MKKLFGVTKNKEKVYKFTLGNKDGFRVEIINFGAVITGIYTEDKFGKYENIVLSYDNLSDYEENPAYIGCTIGRIAGRTKDACLLINSKKYNLSQKVDKNYLHSGEFGINKKIWNIEKYDEKNLLLSVDDFYIEGMPPGNVKIKAEFTLDKNYLIIKYSATTDLTTYINLTNHSYFNLNSGKTSVKNHMLKIKASKYFELDSDIVPFKISNLKDSELDFSKEKLISSAFESQNPQLLKANGIDHPYLLDSDKNQIEISSNYSGRKMNISTDQKTVIVYSGNFLSEARVPSNKVLKDNEGICFECQKPPIINKNLIVLTYPDKPYENFTKYEFFT